MIRIIPIGLLFLLGFAMPGKPHAADSGSMTAASSRVSTAASVGTGIDPSFPVEMSIKKGDTRNGSHIRLRVAGDSLYYSETIYWPETTPLEFRKAVRLNGARRKALKGVMGGFPRYPPFGSCYGKDMRFYMVETPEGKFYRSLPERTGKCYSDEPGIWSLFQDLDDLLIPPDDPDYRDFPAS
ncbi:MAG: hypothetical protein ABI036_14950 [Fibrobacteria bacterium]